MFVLVSYRERVELLQLVKEEARKSSAHLFQQYGLTSAQYEQVEDFIETTFFGTISQHQRQRYKRLDSHEHHHLHTHAAAAAAGVAAMSTPFKVAVPKELDAVVTQEDGNLSWSWL